MHELIHYKQRDMFYKWLIQLVVCAHWFNPFVYLLEKEVNKSCELSCDEKVISVLDDNARREYGDTLISFLKSNNLYKSSLASVTLAEGAEQIKERLGAIMKFRKKSKVIIAITTMFTVAVCFCFLAIGAYAAPITNSESLHIWESNGNIIPESVESNEEVSFSGITPKNEMTICPKCIFPMSKGDIFYIEYTDSVSGTFNVGIIDENGDKLEAETTIWQEGDTASIEVNQDGNYNFYVEGFNDNAGWLNTTFEFSVSYIDKNDESYKYTYTQKGYYCDSYIIEIGWNLSYKNQEYYDATEIVFEDKSKMTVYFSDAAKDYMNDSGAITAIEELIDSLKSASISPEIETPLIVSVTPVAADDIPALTEKYFQNEDLIRFSALFSVLDETAQKDYYKRVYDADKIALFSTIVQDMDTNLVLQYVDKSEQDNKTNFFAVLSDYIQPDDLKRYAEKYYDTGNIAHFTILLDCMAEEEKQEWLRRAQTDKKTNFVAVLSDEFASNSKPLVNSCR